MKTVSAPQLKQMIDRNQDLKLLNVLPSERFQQKHIPGSVNVPFQKESQQAFVERVKKMLREPEKQPVVVYCADRQCNLSPEAARALEGAGFKEVIDFEGGVDAWEQAGFGLEGIKT